MGLHPTAPLHRDWQQLSVGLHQVYPPRKVCVTVDAEGAALGVVHQCLLAVAEGAHQGGGVLAGQVELCDGRRVGDGVAVDAVVAEGLGHVLLLVVGSEDLLVAVDDVLDARGLEREESII